jgi:hypothetical protein
MESIIRILIDVVLFAAISFLSIFLDTKGVPKNYSIYLACALVSIIYFVLFNKILRPRH